MRQIMGEGSQRNWVITLAGPLTRDEMDYGRGVTEKLGHHPRRTPHLGQDGLRERGHGETGSAPLSDPLPGTRRITGEGSQRNWVCTLAGPLTWDEMDYGRGVTEKLGLHPCRTPYLGRDGLQERGHRETGSAPLQDPLPGMRQIMGEGSQRNWVITLAGPLTRDEMDYGRGVTEKLGHHPRRTPHLGQDGLRERGHGETGSAPLSDPLPGTRRITGEGSQRNWVCTLAGPLTWDEMDYGRGVTEKLGLHPCRTPYLGQDGLWERGHGETGSSPSPDPLPGTRRIMGEGSQRKTAPSLQDGTTCGVWKGPTGARGSSRGYTSTCPLGLEDGAQSVAVTIPEETPVQQPVQDSSPRSHGDCGSCSDRLAAPVTFVALLVAVWVLYKLYFYLPFDTPEWPDVASCLTFALCSLSMASIPVLLALRPPPVLRGRHCGRDPPPICCSPKSPEEPCPAEEDCCVILMEDLEDGAQPVVVAAPEEAEVQQPLQDSPTHGSCSDRLAVPVTFVALLGAAWVMQQLYSHLPLETPACPDIASRLAFPVASLSCSVKGGRGGCRLPQLPDTMTAKSPACQLRDLHRSCEDDILGVDKLTPASPGINPSSLSLFSVLSLDSQTSSSPICSSPKSSGEELRPAEDCCVILVEELEDGAQSVAVTMPEEAPVQQPVQDSSPRSHSGSCSDYLAAPVTFVALLVAVDRLAIPISFVALLGAAWVLQQLYSHLPLEIPACPDIASRFGFTLCALSVAGIPALLGIADRSAAGWCQNLLDRLCVRSRTTLPCRESVASSEKQFVVFGLNLMVTATFLPQEQLWLIPILAGLFAFSRICDWAAGLLCSAFRGFATALAVSPSLFMAGYNAYSLYHLGFSFLLAPAPLGDAHPTAAPMPPAGGN
ncbi:UNVERIFIED_CONTAM: hypothetical protein K2H54_014028 [Gekko kuhli]